MISCFHISSGLTLWNIPYFWVGLSYNVTILLGFLRDPCFHFFKLIILYEFVCIFCRTKKQLFTCYRHKCHYVQSEVPYAEFNCKEGKPVGHNPIQGRIRKSKRDFFFLNVKNTETWLQFYVPCWLIPCELPYIVLANWAFQYLPCVWVIGKKIVSCQLKL